MGIVLASWFWLGHLYYVVKCVCDIQPLCHYVIMSSAHCMQIVCCHLHIVCKLCVSFLSISVFVSVIFVMSICCMAIACHVIMSNVICSLSCYGQLVVGCFHESVNTGLVLWSGHLRFYATYLRLPSLFGQCVGWVVFIFRLRMSTLVCEVMKVYLVRMSRCPLWS